MRLIPALAAATLVFAAAAHAETPPDPFTWLEDIHGARALDWVKDQNAKTAARLEGDPRFESYRQQALAIFTAKDRIPYPAFRAGGIDNVWQDKDHAHGVWRHASLDSYRTDAPQWETLLDLDALSKAEGKSWFWKGAQCLRPEERFCLINLSDGGGDAVEVREFDRRTRQFVAPSAGGFHFASGKQRVDWLDKDTLVVAREWGPGAMTASGYPYILKSVHRGQPLSAAETLFQGMPSDGGGVEFDRLRDPDGTVRGLIIERLISDYDVLYALYRGDRARPAPLNLPRKSRLGPFVDGQLTFTIQEDYAGFKAGDLLAYDLKNYPVGQAAPDPASDPAADHR